MVCLITSLSQINNLLSLVMHVRLPLKLEGLLGVPRDHLQRVVMLIKYIVFCY